jgi:hypothetical protein
MIKYHFFKKKPVIMGQIYISDTFVGYFKIPDKLSDISGKLSGIPGKLSGIFGKLSGITQLHLVSWSVKLGEAVAYLVSHLMKPGDT